jgi:hypothetical protein
MGPQILACTTDEWIAKIKHLMVGALPVKLLSPWEQGGRSAYKLRS